MDYNKISINKIKYCRTQIFYDGQKLYINLPIMNCKNGLEEYYNKYQIKLEIDDEKLLKFLKSLEDNNKSHCMYKSNYKSNIVKENDKYILILKVPYRYKKFELNVGSDSIYLPTVCDIKSDTKLSCKILISKIWNYKNEDDNMMSGCIMEVKDINIV